MKVGEDRRDRKGEEKKRTRCAGSECCYEGGGDMYTKYAEGGDALNQYPG